MSHGELMNSAVKESLRRCGALQYGDFVLASGRRSRYYIDIKKASTDPEVLSGIAKEMSSLLSTEGIEYDRIAGVVLGSIPLAVALSLETRRPFVMVRKAIKDYGTGRVVEGALAPGDKVLVVEDVVTSAGSAAEAVKALRAGGAVVETVLVVVDRQEGGTEALENVHVRLIALLTAKDLLEE